MESKKKIFKNFICGIKYKDLTEEEIEEYESEDNEYIEEPIGYQFKRLTYSIFKIIGKLFVFIIILSAITGELSKKTINDIIHAIFSIMEILVIMGLVFGLIGIITLYIKIKMEKLK